MVLESDLQFEDLFACSQVQPRSSFDQFENELDMILGISPLPMQMQGSFVE
jgi:hypothetical protein